MSVDVRLYVTAEPINPIISNAKLFGVPLSEYQVNKQTNNN
jgi:hypothetical protein